MNRWSTVCVSVVLAVATTCPLSAADGFEKVGPVSGLIRFQPPHGRAIAMGEAYTALATGPSAVYWNPAGLVFADRHVGAAYSTRTLLGSDSSGRLHFASGSGALSGIGAGIHITRWSDEFEVQAADGSGGSIEVSDLLGIAGVGIDLARFLDSIPETFGWSTGIGVMFDRREFGDDSQSGFDFDFGTLGSFDPAPEISLRFGYAVLNLTQAKLESDDGHVHFSRRDRAGVAGSLRILEDPRFGPLLEGTLALEGENLLFQDQRDPRGHTGLEVVLAGILSLRGGRIWDLETGDDDRTHWGAGLGLPSGSRISPRVGGSLDFAKFDGPFDKIEQFSLSGWIAL